MKASEQFEFYQLPMIETIEVAYEGVICGSNELLEENEGEW